MEKISSLEAIKLFYDQEATTSQITDKQREYSQFLLEQENYMCISGAVDVSSSDRPITIGKLASNALYETLQKSRLALPGDANSQSDAHETVIIGPNPYVTDGIGLWVKTQNSPSKDHNLPPTIEYL